MGKRFIEKLVQYSNEEFELDIENPMLAAIIRFGHLQTMLCSILFIAEYTVTPLLILVAISI